MFNSLCFAAGKGDLKEVSRLLEKGVYVNAKDGNGWTALHSTAENGHLEIVKLLIDKGADVNAKNGYGITILDSAAGNGRFEVVKLLIDKGADVNAKTDHGDTALDRAASMGHLEVVKLLMDNGADVRKGFNECWSALRAAAFKGHLEVVKLLIDKDPELDKIDCDFGLSDKDPDLDKIAYDFKRHLLEVAKFLLGKGGNWERMAKFQGALHLVALNGDLEIAKDLIEKGADVNAISDWTWMDSIYENSVEWYWEMVLLNFPVLRKWPKRNGSTSTAVGYIKANGWTALNLAAWVGHLEIVKLLIDKGADVNVKDGNGRTSLDSAMMECDWFGKDTEDVNARNKYYKTALEIVEFLIDKGADVKTALDLAASKGHLEIVRLLIGRGADMNARNNWFRGALHSAAGNGHLEIVKLLIDAGADVNAKDGGMTELDLAASKGHLEIVKLLIDKGADVNARGEGGSTALHSTAWNGYLEIVKLLLEKGADVNARLNNPKGGCFGSDNKCRTALHLAASKGHLEVVMDLIGDGADVNAKDGRDNTVLHSAIMAYKDVREFEKTTTDVKSRDKYYITALELVKLLIDKGADVNARDKEGNTALHSAAAGGYLEIVRLLIGRGADMNARNNWCRVALHSAAGNGHLEIVKLLIDKGEKTKARVYGELVLVDRNIKAKDADGNTPMNLAKQYGHKEIEKLWLCKKFCVNGLFSFLDEQRGFRSPKETPMLIPFALTVAPCLRTGWQIFGAHVSNFGLA